MTDYATQVICFAFGMLVVVFLWALMSTAAQADREMRRDAERLREKPRR